MDVFNSALRNPLPPSRKNSRRNGDSSHNSDEDATTSPKEAESAPRNEPESRNKKKSSRRKHRNSHLGCGICKKRRIKCDENLPQCFNCIKGKLQCAYLKLDAPARNALRMAQYNQNLRDDKQEETPIVTDIASAKYASTDPQLEASQIPVIINHPDYYSSYMAKMPAPIAQPYLPLQEGSAFPAQYPSEGGLSKVVNSQYGPLMQLQSMPSGMTYAVPVQIVNTPQMMYQGVEQLQHTAYNTQVQGLPPRNPDSGHSHSISASIPYKQTPQAYDSAPYSINPLTSGHHTPISSIMTNPPPDIHSATYAEQRSENSLPAAPRVSVSLSPSSSTAKPLLPNEATHSRASPSKNDISSSTTPNPNELGLRPPPVDPASSATSPLQSSGSLISQPSEDVLNRSTSQTDLPQEPRVKLAPIRVKVENEKDLSPVSVREAEKVPSIRMLLS